MAKPTVMNFSPYSFKVDHLYHNAIKPKLNDKQSKKNCTTWWP